MVRLSWAAGAALFFIATAATAAPLPVVRADAVVSPTAVEQVEFYYPYGPYYAPPPPPAYYYGRPRRPPSYAYPGPYGYYDKEAAKDYVKGYRRGQKEILKDQARAWNRAHGF